MQNNKESLHVYFRVPEVFLISGAVCRRKKIEKEMNKLCAEVMLSFFDCHVKGSLWSF